MATPREPRIPMVDVRASDVGGKWDSEYHAPVMVAEVLALLASARSVLDATLGGGGHSLALLGAGAEVWAVDRDPDAIVAARQRLVEWERRGRFHPIRANYAELGTVPELSAIRFDGILLDLGISSRQIDETGRGFSFREGAPLDMRMGDGAERDGAAILNETEERELARVFREYADEPRAGRLAREVVRRRQNRPFVTSDDLVGAIRGALGARTGPGDFARIFQGIRIAVNDELVGLERALPSLRDRLAPGGVLAVIAYHSGEDRLVKHAFREWSRACVCPPRQPRCVCGGIPRGELLTRKAVSAPADETARNPRARSAHLRAWRSAAR